MSATSVRGRQAIRRSGSLDAAIDESSHRVVFFMRSGHKKLEAMERDTLAWLKAKHEREMKSDTANEIRR